MAAMPYPYHTSLIIFLSVATVVGLAGLAVMHVSRNVAFTRRHLLWYVIFEGILLLVVGAALGLPALLLAIMVLRILRLRPRQDEAAGRVTLDDLANNIHCAGGVGARMRPRRAGLPVRDVVVQPGTDASSPGRSARSRPAPASP